MALSSKIWRIGQKWIRYPAEYRIRSSVVTGVVGLSGSRDSEDLVTRRLRVQFKASLRTYL